MKKIQHPGKAFEANILFNASIDEKKAYFQKYWLLGQHQILLMNPEMSETRELYLSLRRPCADFVALALESRDMALINKAVIGCSLNIANEKALIELQDSQLLKDYLQNNPNGPTLSDEAMEILNALDNREMSKVADEYCFRNETSPGTPMSALFSSELLLKLGLA